MQFLLTFICFSYFAINPEIEDILANLAALLVLNEIDNIVGFLLHMKIHKLLPKVMFQSEDSFMMEQVKIQS